MAQSVVSKQDIQALPAASAFPPLSDLQHKIIASNYVKAGVLYRSNDIHTMLDCGPEPETRTAPPRNSAELPATLAPAAPGRLRQEFFGGIFYDMRRHALFNLDRLGFALVDAALRSGHIAAIRTALAASSHTAADIDSGLHQLIAAGILADAESPDAHSISEIEFFPAQDLTRGYLQVPFVVEIEGTHGCYRRCAHCAYDASPDVDRSGELTTQEWRLILDKLSAGGVLSVRFTGGDFLFRDDAMEILQYADQAGLSFHLLSDTVAFNDRALKTLSGFKNLAYVGSSIDGATAEVHDRWRGPGAFDLLLHRVEKIAASGIMVSLGATLHKGNYLTVREMGRIASRAGARHFEIGFLTPVGRGEGLADAVLEGPQVREALALYLAGIAAGEYRPLQGHYLRRVSADVPFADVEPIIDTLPYLTEWPYSRMRVKPTGVTYTAGRLRATPFAKGVNLLTEDLQTVWDRSPNLAFLRSIADGCRLHSLDFRNLPMDLRYG
jgi:MoaA/NifB/PqqE/SkfB family radical SAM enzyme